MKKLRPKYLSCPAEIWLEILIYIDHDRKALLALCLTNKLLYVLCQPRIYQKVTLQPKVELSSFKSFIDTKSKRFYQSLKANASLAGLVQELTIIWDEHAGHRWKTYYSKGHPCTAAAIDLLRSGTGLLKSREFALWLELISSLKEVKRFSFTCSFWYQPLPHQDFQMFLIAHALSCMKKLECLGVTEPGHTMTSTEAVLNADVRLAIRAAVPQRTIVQRLRKRFSPAQSLPRQEHEDEITTVLPILELQNIAELHLAVSRKTRLKEFLPHCEALRTFSSSWLDGGSFEADYTDLQSYLLPSISTLRELNLSDAIIPSEAPLLLRNIRISGLPNLAKLNIKQWHFYQTDTSEELFQLLLSGPRLEELNWRYNTNCAHFSPSAVETLQRALLHPGCRIRKVRYHITTYASTSHWDNVFDFRTLETILQESGIDAQCTIGDSLVPADCSLIL
jgi:hypothetical protein